MRRFTAVLAIFATLGTAATAAWATSPGKNGQLVFRRYLDAARTTGALFTANPDGSQMRQLTHPARSVIDQQPDWSPNGRKLAFERNVACPAGGPRNGLDNTLSTWSGVCGFAIAVVGTGVTPEGNPTFDCSGECTRRRHKELP